MDRGQGGRRLAGLGTSLAGIVAAAQASLFPLTTPPVVTSRAFVDWAHGYVRASVDSAPLARAATVYFSPGGDDDTGNGTIVRPYRTIAKANEVLNAHVDGNIRVRFRAGGVFRSAVGLVVPYGHTTVDAYFAPGDGPSLPKPVLTAFEPEVPRAAWTVEPFPGVFSVPVAADVAWAKYLGDETTVFRRMLTLDDCSQTEGSWFCGAGRLYVHAFADTDLRDTDRRIEFVYKNTQSGVFVADVPDVRIHRIRVEGFGAGTPGDHSYTGYGIELHQSGPNRAVVTSCETYYNGRHSITKVGGPKGGSLVVVGCRMGWLVNDGINCVSYSGGGEQELVSAHNEYLGSELPSTNRPYPYGGGSAPEYLHTDNDFLSKHAFYLSLESRIVAGDYQSADIPAPASSPSFSDLANCRSFVVGFDAPIRTPNALDATKPSSNGGHGLTYFRLGSANTVYAGCTVRPTALWSQGSPDMGLCTSAHGLWVNSDIVFDYRFVGEARFSRVMAVSPTNATVTDFDASFTACRIRFLGQGGGGNMGFSGPMVHRWGANFNSMSARWLGRMNACIVDAQGVGNGTFFLGFGNDPSQIDGNAYYGLSGETGAYGVDSDTHRFIGTALSGRPGEDDSLVAAGPILLAGRPLEYDKEGRTRPRFPTIGPLEPVRPSGKPFPGTGSGIDGG